MKKIDVSSNRARAVVPMGTIKTQTKGSADVGPDGTQSQPRSFIGLD